MHLIRSPLAESDLSEIAKFLGEDSEVVALRFLAKAEEAFQKLSEMPEMGGAT